MDHGRGRPVRVGVVTTSYPREEGDPAGNFVEGFTRWLRSRGAEVVVVAAGPGGDRVGGVEVERVDGRGLFYAGGAPEALGGGRPWAWAAAAAFQAELAARVAARLAREEWAAAVSHWVAPSSLAVESARSVARLARAGAGGAALPHLAIAHSSDVWLLHRSRGGRAALRWVARRADLVYAGAHLAVAGAAAGAPGRVVAMGVDVGALRGDRERGRRRFGLTRPTALFLGRLVPVKGIELLVEALPEGLDLVIAGDGPLREALSRRAGPHLRMVGEVRGEARADLMAAADLVVLPSLILPDGRQEGSPTVLREALVAGRPLLATRTGDARSLVGPHGVLVEPAVPALREALARFLHDPRGWPAPPSPDAARAHDWSSVGPILAGSLLDSLPGA